MSEAQGWFSERLGMETTLVRWGHWGTPVLLLPTGGGDPWEAERMGLVHACRDLLAAGRVKLYSVDSIAGRAMIERWGTPGQRLALLNAFHHHLRCEVVPAIRADSGGGEPPILTAGASIGAFNALALLCRWPDAVRAAVCMSGTYDLQAMYGGAFDDDLYFASPLHFVPGMEEGPVLDQLRQRFALIAAGEGAWENIAQSWRVAEVLGARGIPNRVDSWGPDWAHDWPTWRVMLPHYLAELA